MVTKWIQFTAIMVVFLSVIPSQWFNVLGAVIVLLAGSAMLVYNDHADRGKIDAGKDYADRIETQAKQIQDLKERFEILRMGRK